MHTEAEDVYKGKLKFGDVYPPNTTHEISDGHITTLQHNEDVTGEPMNTLIGVCSENLQTIVKGIPSDRWPETSINTMEHWIQMHHRMMQMKVATSLKEIEMLDAVWKEYSARLAVVAKNTRKSTTNLSGALASRKSAKEKASEDMSKATRKAEEEHIKALDKVRLDRMKNVLLPSGIVFYIYSLLAPSSRDNISTRYHKHLAKEARKSSGCRWPFRPGTQSRLTSTIRMCAMWTCCVLGQYSTVPGWSR